MLKERPSVSCFPLPGRTLEAMRTQAIDFLPNIWTIAVRIAFPTLLQIKLIYV
jgi:hypothetical protein